MTLEQFIQQQKKPEVSFGEKSAEAGISAAANLASGLFKAQQMQGAAARELEEKKNLSIAEAQNKAMASQTAGMTAPLSALIANYRASLK